MKMSTSLDSSCQDNIVHLLRHKWNVYYSSPLGLKHKNKYSIYSRLISKYLNNMNWAEGQKFKVKMSLCSNLTLSKNVPASLKVEVYMSSKPTYKAYFLNWSSEWENLEERYSLPMLLANAAPFIRSRVHDAFSYVFDCRISPMNLNENLLITSFALMVFLAVEGELKFARLKYHCPNMPSSDAITTSLRVKDLTQLFNFFNRPELYGSESVPSFFYKKILQHFQMAFQLNLKNVKLSEVSFPDAVLKEAGQIIFYREDIISPLLSALQESIHKSNFVRNTSPTYAPSGITEI